MTTTFLGSPNFSTFKRVKTQPVQIREKHVLLTRIQLNVSHPVRIRQKGTDPSKTIQIRIQQMILIGNGTGKTGFGFGKTEFRFDQNYSYPDPVNYSDPDPVKCFVSGTRSAKNCPAQESHCCRIRIYILCIHIPPNKKLQKLNHRNSNEP